MVSPVEAFTLVSERKQQLRKVFTEFEAKKFSLGRIGATWKDIEEHFKEIETCLQKTHEAYNAKEKAFQDRMKAVQADLDKREAEVSAKEQASINRVQAQKQAAVQAIVEQKRKLADDKRLWEAEKRRSEKDDMVDGESKRSKNGTKILDAGASSMKKVSSIKNGAHTVNKKEISVVTQAENNKAVEGSASLKEKAESSRPSVEPRPRLKSVCQSMDPKGFRNLILENQKELKKLQDEVPSALKLCSDPAQLVLNILEGYFNSGTQVLNKDEGYACNMLLEALMEVQGYSPAISANIKSSAKHLGDKWKASLKLEGDIAFNLVLLGRSFLHFVAAFNLSSEYNHEELVAIVVKVAQRKQTPRLFRLLGLAHKASDVIEKLIKDGKFLEAVSFACEFNLLEEYPAEPLFKAHIKDAKKAARAIKKSGTKSLSALQNEALQKELAALKAVANTVKEYKLEGHYTLAVLDKKMAKLEDSKAERKRQATASKPEPPFKKLHADDGSPGSGKKAIPSPGRLLYGLQDRNFYDGTEMPPYGSVAMHEMDRRPIGQFDRRPIGEFDRRPVGEYDRRPLGDFDRRPVGEFDHRSLSQFDRQALEEADRRRSLGLYGSAYGGPNVNSLHIAPFTHSSLGPTSLGYRSPGHGEQLRSLSGYNYASSLGGFRSYP